jgi:hypothetical protein
MPRLPTPSRSAATNVEIILPLPPDAIVPQSRCSQVRARAAAPPVPPATVVGLRPAPQPARTRPTLHTTTTSPHPTQPQPQPHPLPPPPTPGLRPVRPREERDGVDHQELPGRQGAKFTAGRRGALGEPLRRSARAPALPRPAARRRRLLRLGSPLAAPGGRSPVLTPSTHFPAPSPPAARPLAPGVPAARELQPAQRGGGGGGARGGGLRSPLAPPDALPRSCASRAAPCPCTRAHPPPRPAPPTPLHPQPASQTHGKMPPIKVKFEIPYFTVSGLQVRGAVGRALGEEGRVAGAGVDVPVGRARERARRRWGCRAAPRSAASYRGLLAVTSGSRLTHATPPP